MYSTFHEPRDKRMVKVRKPQNGKHGEPRTSIDEDIFTTQLEETGDVLEDERERVRLPVVGVVGELDSSLDICISRSVSLLLLATYTTAPHMQPPPLLRSVIRRALKHRTQRPAGTRRSGGAQIKFKCGLPSNTRL